MPRYGLPEKTIRIALPSTSGAEVWGPGELPYDAETRILSRSQRTEINPITQEGMTIMDPAVFEYELIHTWLEHQDAGWNLFDANDNGFERDRSTIDRVFRGQSGRKDRSAISERLIREFFPEMLPPTVVAPTASSEGNDEAASEPPSDSSQSPEPSSLNPSMTNTNPSLVEIGSTPSPGVEASPALP